VKIGSIASTSLDNMVVVAGLMTMDEYKASTLGGMTAEEEDAFANGMSLIAPDFIDEEAWS